MLHNIALKGDGLFLARGYPYGATCEPLIVLVARWAVFFRRMRGGVDARRRCSSSAWSKMLPIPMDAPLSLMCCLGCVLYRHAEDQLAWVRIVFGITLDNFACFKCVRHIVDGYAALKESQKYVIRPLEVMRGTSLLNRFQYGGFCTVKVEYVHTVPFLPPTMAVFLCPLREKAAHIKTGQKASRAMQLAESVRN